MGFSITILLHQISSSGSEVRWSQPPCSGKYVCVTLDHGGVQEGTHPKSVASLYILQKSRSSSSLTTDCMASLRGGLSPLHTRPHGQLPSIPCRTVWHLLPSLSAHPYFKCSAWNFIMDLISSPSYDVLMSATLANSSISFTFFQLPSLVRARVPSDFQGGHLLPTSWAGTV